MHRRKHGAVRFRTLADETSYACIIRTFENETRVASMRTPNILLLEDEALIALDVETTLTDIEVGSVTNIASCRRVEIAR